MTASPLNFINFSGPRLRIYFLNLFVTREGLVSFQHPRNKQLLNCLRKGTRISVLSRALEDFKNLVADLSSLMGEAEVSMDKDKRFIENWNPISLLNVDTKIISKSLASRFLTVLPTIISSDQTAYVKGRYIGESIRLISDVLDTSKALNVSGYMLTVDLQKAFDSIDHIFLLACLEKFGFGRNFID